MDLSDKGELGAAISRLLSVTSVRVPPEVREDYMRGKIPHVVAYEKRVALHGELPALAKYALLAESFILQPSLEHYYDIFRPARAVPLVRQLDRAVSRLSEARVRGLGERLSHLRRVKDLDDLDATIFELVTGERYGVAFGFDRVEFVQEKRTERTPDLRIATADGAVSVECKKFDRMSDLSVSLSDQARVIADVVLKMALQNSVAAVFEVVFAAAPSAVRSDALRDAAFESLRTGSRVQTKGASVFARRLATARLDDYALFPSPKYFLERFGYAPQDWHGIVPHMRCNLAGPSFIDQVDWDSAVIWRVENESLAWKVKRLGFDRIFDGLKQLKKSQSQSILHVWFERSIAQGHRKQQLLKLADALSAQTELDFAWVVLNETVSDVSASGRFDFQEHASLIRGAAVEEDAPVRCVFVDGSDVAGDGEWGVGVSLPPL